MKHELGQIFYGRGFDGYGILGSSPAGRPFAGAVAALCRAVGSPDRPGDVRPFLLSKREGSAVVMIRASRGAADPTGRATIFFHALIADEASLRAAGLDAFALADAGLFAGSCPDPEPPDLPLPGAVRREDAPTGGGRVDMPAAISSERPLDGLVRREVGGRSLDLNWATFTFNPLPGFDLFVLSSYSPRKGTGTMYSFDGERLHRLSSGGAQWKREVSGEPPAIRPSRKGSPLLLFLSLAANVALLLAYLLHAGYGDGDGIGEAPAAAAMTEAEAKARWEGAWRKEWMEKLQSEFAKSIESSGGEWPIRFNDDNSPFTHSVRSALTEPDEEKLACKWRIYRSCITCSAFIEKHFFVKPTSQTDETKETEP